MEDGDGRVLPRPARATSLLEMSGRTLAEWEIREALRCLETDAACATGDVERTDSFITTAIRHEVSSLALRNI